MKNMWKAVLLGAVVLPGCATTGLNSKTGLALVGLQVEAGEAGTIGSKSGEACSTSILGIVATGDSSLVAAAKAGGITKIGTVDFAYTRILGIYGQVCTQVTGE
jgi:hypothetical protein